MKIEDVINRNSVRQNDICSANSSVNIDVNITAFSAGNELVKNPKLDFLALNDKNSKYINLDGCYRY